MHQLFEFRNLFEKQGLLLHTHGSSAGLQDVKITALSSDSRALLQGSHSQDAVLYFARRGATKDGHSFLKELEAREEISAFIVEESPTAWNPKAPVLVVRDATLAMALVAKHFYGDPTSAAVTLAVTGTNGKTTSTFLLQSLLNCAGRRSAVSGTVMIQFEDFRVSSPLTTPDFSVMQQSFAELRSKGADAFVFEASSHALDQRRLLGIELNGAIFTNLSPEHLDYHRSMENYFAAKRKLFSELLRGSRKDQRWAVIPRDGSYGSRLVEEFESSTDFNLWTWGYQSAPSTRHLWIKEYATSLEGSSFTLEVGREAGNQKILRVGSRLIGKYNIENLTGMIAAGFAMGISEAVIQQALKNTPYVPGRLEPVAHREKLHVFVDYAHTPDALENVLSTLRQLCHGRLIVVFGCGGDRDRAKRPIMGQVAELYADELFVTSDNPRTEEPQAIIDEIVSGIQGLKKTTIEVDRAAAIEKALALAQPEDVVLIAGKGHETYQIIGDKKIHFDDREVARRALESRA